VRFSALLHHITVDLLRQSYIALKRDAAPGIDGVTWQTYGENLEAKLKDLHERIHKGSYRARPARRSYIPKADGSKRALSITERGSQLYRQRGARHGMLGHLREPAICTRSTSPSQSSTSSSLPVRFLPITSSHAQMQERCPR
jgi:hypothetical protein